MGGGRARDDSGLSKLRALDSMSGLVFRGSASRDGTKGCHMAVSSKRN